MVNYGMFIETKLAIPPAGPHLVARPRLLAQLDAGLARRVTLLSAPAGAGKTSLAAAWLRHVQEAGGDYGTPAVAWVTLDEGDNEPRRFLSYLATALKEAGHKSGSVLRGLLENEPQASASTLVTVLANELLKSERPVVLALDEYEQIAARAVHEAVAQLIEQGPQSLHLALITRSDPPLPLARLRARGQMQEVSGSQLRFSMEETSAFLRKALRQPLPEAQVAALWERSEGWAAGLQLAALSLQRGEDTDRVIRDFSGRQPDVFDYLVQEVLEQQEADVQDFLLQTSVLPRLNAPLCDAVRGDEDAEALLRTLYRANLFLVRMDDGNRDGYEWYRYHPLFAQALRLRLRAGGTPSEDVLHARAASWFAEAGMAEDAVAQALEADDAQLAADLVARFGQRMWTANRAQALLGWLDALPEVVVHRRPYLGLLRAWSLWLTSRWFAVGPALEAAEASMETAEARDAEPPAAELASMAAAIRASLALSEQQPERAAQHAQVALEGFQENVAWRAIVSQVLGDSFRALGEWQAAVVAYGQSVALGQAQGNVYATLSALRSRAEVFHLQGRLRQAESGYRRALQAAEAMDGQRLTATANVHIWLGRLLCARHELDEAQAHLQEGIDICRPQNYAVGLIMGHAELAQVHALRGDLKSAWETLGEARTLASVYPLQNMEPYLQRVAARLHLEDATARSDGQGLQAMQAAASWLEERGFEPDRPTAGHLEDGLLYAHWLVLQGEWTAALAALGQLRARAQKERRAGALVRVLCLEAPVLAKQEAQVAAQEAASERLRRALQLAAPEDLVRPFVEVGSALMPLLARIVGADEEQAEALAPATASFARRLQTILAANAARQQATNGGGEISFTSRERDVIPLLAAGLPNRQIAQEMVVAESTVKTHLSNIYAKLDVENRTQAVARLRALKLI